MVSSNITFLCRTNMFATCVLLMIIECISLKLLELRVPAHVPLGYRVELSCHWQLAPTDILYSVKWYKDGKEFFRHVPRDLEPRRKFPLPGVVVERSDATGSSVTLSPATFDTGGRYRCEVSGERPLFPTVSDHGDLLVVVLPDHGPAIIGFKPRYGVGDRVKVNCTSGHSWPATQLTWYINGEPAPASSVLPPTQNIQNELVVTSLTLDFQVTEKYFENDGIKVKCLATIAPIYWRSNEESAFQFKKRVFEGHARRRISGTHTEHRVYNVNSAPCLKFSEIFVTLVLYFISWSYYIVIP